MKTQFNLEERLKKFKRLFVESLPEYSKGQPQQKQNYKNHLQETGDRDVGVRGINNSFGFKLIRRPVYIKDGKETYNGYGYPYRCDTNIVLAPEMEDDSSITLEMDRHFKSYTIPTPVPWDSNALEKEIMSFVERIFLMTNEEVMRLFSVNYPFSTEMLARFEKEDAQIHHIRAEQDLRESLQAGRELDTQIIATPTHDELVV